VSGRRWWGRCVCCGRVGELAGWTSAGFCVPCVDALPRIMEDADRGAREELNR